MIHYTPKIPWFLWPGIALFFLGLLWFLAYELYAVFTHRVPTISAIVIPSVRSHLVLSSIIGLIIFTGLLLLVYDWFIRVLPNTVPQVVSFIRARFQK